MDFCEANGIDYILGLPTNAVLRADPTIATVADACATQRAEEDRPVLRLFAETRYAAKSWKHQRRVVARIEASTMGMDIRTVVTSLIEPGPELDFVRLGSEAEGLHHTHHAWFWNILRFPVWRGVLINVADPDLESDGSDGVTERQTGLSVPGGGVRRACAGQQIAGP